MMLQLATFYIGKEIFAVDILLTKEIGRISEITPVPESPDHIIGLMNLRGQILTIMDPRRFLDEDNTSVRKHEDQQLIILKTDTELEPLKRQGLTKQSMMTKDPLAIVIDSMGDVLNTSSDQILPPPPNLSGVRREFVSGVVPQKENLIIILAMDQLTKMCVDQSNAILESNSQTMEI